MLHKATGYLPVIIRGWSALVSAIHPNGLLGWVQPIDAQPRPSHPWTTQEYAVGPFLTAGGQVYLLVEGGVITPAHIQAALPAYRELLPPAAVKTTPLTARDHPLSKQITAFLKVQQEQEPRSDPSQEERLPPCHRRPSQGDASIPGCRGTDH